MVNMALSFGHASAFTVPLGFCCLGQTMKIFLKFQPRHYRNAGSPNRLHRSSRITLRFIRAMLGRSGYSTWAPEAFTRSPQFATSLLTNASAASAESPGSSPLRLRFSVALELSVIELIALFSAATTLAGVPFGTQNPTQDEPSAPGYPSSARLGQLGRSG